MHLKEARICVLLHRLLPEHGQALAGQGSSSLSLSLTSAYTLARFLRDSSEPPAVCPFSAPPSAAASAAAAAATTSMSSGIPRDLTYSRTAHTQPKKGQGKGHGHEAKSHSDESGHGGWEPQRP